MEETPLEADSTFAAPSKKKINKRFVYLIIVILFLLVAFFGFKFFGGSKNADINNQPAVLTPTQIPTSTPEALPSNSPTPSLTPTLTPKPTLNPLDKSTGLDRSKLSVTIQNGSGQAGVAGKASDILKNLGYDVVATENADNFDYVNVVIQVKSLDSDFLDLLKKDLSGSYTIGTTSANLSSSFSSDALVIIGK